MYNTTLYFYIYIYQAVTSNVIIGKYLQPEGHLVERIPLQKLKKPPNHHVQPVCTRNMFHVTREK